MDEKHELETVIDYGDGSRYVAAKDPTAEDMWVFGWDDTEEPFDPVLSSSTGYSEGLLTAMALFWLRKHPHLLSQVLSEEQKEALDHAIVDVILNRPHDAQVLQSILSPKEV